MTALPDLIEARELAVQCRPCGWTEQRCVSWLSTQRDMICPSCQRVIVLNTSEIKRKIASLRRQCSTMHKQLVEIIPSANHCMQRDTTQLNRVAVRTQTQFALMQVYRSRTSRRVLDKTEQPENLNDRTQAEPSTADQ